jgi:DNA-directed RNA polymerase subunit RPC12/RpoP
MRTLLRFGRLMLIWVRRDLVFYRDDGVKINVTTFGCSRCKNFFFVAFAEIELPHFCPYCGLKFKGRRKTADFQDRFPI